MAKKSRRQRQKNRPEGAKSEAGPPNTSAGAGGAAFPRSSEGRVDKEAVIKMLSKSLVSQQTDFVSAIMDGSIGDKLAPPDFVEEEIAALPLTDMAWFVDYNSQTDMTEDPRFRSGYCTEVMFKVGLVEKEHGSNGLPWGDIIREDECDGLSFVMAWCGEVFDGKDDSVKRFFDGMVKSLAKACLIPQEHLRATYATGIFPSSEPSPGRPRRVLVRSQGIMRDLKPKLRRFGIPEVGVADEPLVNSMTAGFASSPSEDSFGASIFNQVHESFGGGNMDRISLEAAVAAATGPSLLRLTAESGYVEEDRKPLGSWRPEASAVPKEWFARPPTRNELQLGYRDRMLWGWRTNMELAVERNDGAMISGIASRHPRDQVKDLVEMRLLLTKAAEKGLLGACEALIKPHPSGPGASVDGVPSSTNKDHWRALQRSSGDQDMAESQTPLNRAAQHGNTAVVALLMQKGADPNLVNAYQGAGPLHYAVSRAHKDCVVHLLKGGPGGRSDIHVHDYSGRSPMILARGLVEETGQSRYKSIASILEEYDLRGDTREEISVGSCAECGKAGARKRCPCGDAIFCSKECQAQNWKAHKRDHRRLMAGKEKSSKS